MKAEIENNYIVNHRILEKVRNHKLYPFMCKLMRDNWGSFIAGGVFKDILTGRNVKDIDLFFDNKQNYLKALRNFGKDHELLYQSDNCISYRVYINPTKTESVVVELIYNEFSNIKNTLDRFDFNISKIGMYPEHRGFFNGMGNIKILSYPGAISDILRGKLKIINYNNPVGNLVRVIKYNGYGFKTSKHEFAKLLIEVQKQLNNAENGGQDLMEFLNNNLKDSYKY